MSINIGMEEGAAKSEKHQYNSKFNKSHLLAAVLLAVIALIVTVSNLGINKAFIGDDAGVTTHYPSTYFSLASNMWDTISFPGRSNVIATTGLIHVSFINVLSKIGFSPNIVDRIYYFLCLFVSSLGMYFLASFFSRKIFKIDDKKMFWAAMTAAVFYMLNNFTMILFSFPPTSYMYSYVLLPWLFLFYINNFHIDKSLFKKTIFALLFLLLLSGNPSNTIIIIFLLVIYELFIRKENKAVHNLRSLSTTILLVLLFSSYIYLPTIVNSGNPYGQMLASDVQSSINYNSSASSLVKLFVFRGHPAENTFSFSKFLLDNRVVFINYLLVLVILIPLFKRKITKTEIFFYGIFLGMVFLAKGEHVPFATINKFLYDHVPLFGMYRANYYKFVFYCVFSFAVLLSLGVCSLYRTVGEKPISGRPMLALLFLPLVLVLVGAEPFFQGIVARDLHKTVIPVEYQEAKKYLDNDKSNFSVLSLPQLSSGATLDWGDGNFYGSGSNPDQFLIGQPVWSSDWFLPNKLAASDWSSYKTKIKDTNIRYVLLHKDIPEVFSFGGDVKGVSLGQTAFNQLNDQISKDTDLSVVVDNNHMKIFKINEKIRTDHLFVPNSLVLSKLAFKDSVVEPARQPGVVVYYNDQNANKKELLESLAATYGSNTSSLVFKQINPTKYRVVVSNLNVATPVVFAESFDIGWKAYQVNHNSGKSEITGEDRSLASGNVFETMFKEPVFNDQTHVSANGYENSWIVDPAKMCTNNSRCTKNADGSYNVELVIEFWPQKLFYLGLFMFALSFLVCIKLIIAETRHLETGKDA